MSNKIGCCNYCFHIEVTLSSKFSDDIVVLHVILLTKIYLWINNLKLILITPQKNLTLCHKKLSLGIDGLYVDNQQSYILLIL